MNYKRTFQISAYITTFIVGMWGGNLLIRYLNNNSEGQQLAQSMVNQSAPAFSLPDLAAIPHHSSEWEGQVVVLNFWATWCPPCRTETPTFVELQEEYAAQGVQFIGVAIDENQKVADFMDTYGINYPMLIGEDDAIDVSRAFGNRYGALPYTVIIDRKGTIRHIQRGELKRETALESIRQLL